MKKITEEKIHNLVCEKIRVGVFGHSSYWDWYRWIKSLDFGHHPTKEETNEILFFGLSLKQNPDNWRDGAKQMADKAFRYLKQDI